MQLNTTELKNLYSTDQDAKIVLDALSTKRKNVSETKLENLHSDLGDSISYSGVLSVARKLEKVGAGSLIVGRKGGSTRIQWNVPVCNIGKYAVGEINDIQETPKVQTIEHSYAIRPGLVVKFELPTDLTQSETQRLGDFIKTLYFA